MKDGVLHLGQINTVPTSLDKFEDLLFVVINNYSFSKFIFHIAFLFFTPFIRIH